MGLDHSPCGYSDKLMNTLYYVIKVYSVLQENQFFSFHLFFNDQKYGSEDSAGLAISDP